MADFEIAVRKLLKHEGGLVDDPRDPGGLTNKGIALNAHPELTADEIRNLTDDQAAEIYRAKYWQARFDEISSQKVATSLLDMVADLPSGGAIKLLQMTLKRLQAGPIVTDGVFGPATVAAVNACEEAVLLPEFTVQRLLFYAGCKGQEEFFHSWFARTIDCLF